jgi:drug/metabolite transporter (DMT)-like permease
MRVIKVNPMPPGAEYVRKIVPLGLATCTCMFLGNYAYIGLSLSFISILKALTPAVTLILAVMWGMEKMSGVAFVSTLLIAYGTGTATVDETNKEADFHWPSFISFTTSIIFEASRVVFVSIALKDTKYSSFDLLAGVGPLIFAVLSSLSLVMEWDTLVDLTSAEVIYLAYMMVLIVLLSFLVNISTYAAIKYSSSTTVKVVGTCAMYRMSSARVEC